MDKREITMKKRKKHGSLSREFPAPEVVKGIIIPAEVDEDFNAVSIMISTDQEEDILIADDAIGEELFEHMRETIKITGILRMTEEGDKIIAVTKYEILDNL